MPRTRFAVSFIAAAVTLSLAGASAHASIGTGPLLIFADIFNPDFDAGSIKRVEPTGVGLIDVVPTGGGLRGLDVDPITGRVYWTDVNNFVIRRANLDGSAQEDLISSGLEFPSAIAVDVAGGKFYWGDQTANEIRRANLDGSVNEQVLPTAFHRGIDIDAVNGKVYWSTSITQFKGEILRANLDGSDVETVITSLDAQFKPADLALDVEGGKVYWTDFVVDVVRRANLDGTGIQNLFIVGANFNPRGIALDLEAGHVYWGQDIEFSGATGKIKRMNFDGSNPIDAVLGLGLVNSIALRPADPCPADLTGDGIIDGEDLGLLLLDWKVADSPADLTGDGVVNGEDLGVLLLAWGRCGK
jgi:DNA-binding beta-propeller fold protein YncE